MRKLNKGEFCYAKNEEQAKELCEANGLRYVRGIIAAVGFFYDKPGFANTGSDTFYERAGLKEVSFDELCGTVSTPAVSLADVYVLNEDVDEHLKKGCVIVYGKNRHAIFDDGEFMETPRDTVVRLETIIKHAPGMLTKLTYN